MHKFKLIFEKQVNIKYHIKNHGIKYIFMLFFGSIFNEVKILYQLRSKEIPLHYKIH
jgi:hypothetical protein